MSERSREEKRCRESELSKMISLLSDAERERERGKGGKREREFERKLGQNYANTLSSLSRFRTTAEVRRETARKGEMQERRSEERVMSADAR